MKANRTLIFLAAALNGCAQLHHIQISDIDSTRGDQVRFDVKASETGVNVGEANGIVQALGKSSTVHSAANSVSAAWALITYGPRTGNPTFSDSYGDALAHSIESVCPSRKIAMLTSIRESAHYPVISGEIVQFVGYCETSSSLRSPK